MSGNRRRGSRVGPGVVIARIAVLGALGALGACATRGADADAPTVGNRTAATPTTTPTPVVTQPAPDPDCPLAWDELIDIAPPTIALAPLPGEPEWPEECPLDFDPAATLAGCADCVAGRMTGDRAGLLVDGPAGSGRFYNLGLVVDGPRPMYACMMASTVAWRHLVEVADRLAPLPWLDDLDGDGDAELITWHRLPWGSSEFENALVPVVYVRAGDQLVRRDDRARALAARVADAYRALATRGTPGPEPACQRAITAALDGWGR